jgi:hypothetical protein
MRGRECFTFSATPDGVACGVTSAPVVVFRTAGIPFDFTCTPISAKLIGAHLTCIYRLTDCKIPDFPASDEKEWDLGIHSFEIHWDQENVGFPDNHIVDVWSKSWFSSKKIPNLFESGLNSDAVTSVTHERPRNTDGSRRSPRRIYRELTVTFMNTFTVCCYGKMLDKIFASKKQRDLPKFQTFIMMARRVGEGAIPSLADVIAKADKDALEAHSVSQKKRAKRKAKKAIEAAAAAQAQLLDFAPGSAADVAVAEALLDAKVL